MRGLLLASIIVAGTAVAAATSSFLHGPPRESVVAQEVTPTPTPAGLTPTPTPIGVPPTAPVNAIGRLTIPRNEESASVSPPVPVDPAETVVLITFQSSPGVNRAWVSLQEDSFTVHLVGILGAPSLRHPAMELMYEVVNGP